MRQTTSAFFRGLFKVCEHPINKMDYNGGRSVRNLGQKLKHLKRTWKRENGEKLVVKEKGATCSVPKEDGIREDS